jgi:PD-(D/E)XK nuclease superfamily
MPERFLSLIVTMLPAFREMEQRLDRETGRQFNAFDLFDMNENATSRILTFLLDPKGAHGQNDVFLRPFIERFVPAWQGTFDYPKAHMASTTEPIDVTICDGSHWLGIENKIFGAQEQNLQAERYLNSLRAAPSQKDYRLVYLSPRGSPPGDYSLPAESRRVHGVHLVCGSWAQAEGDGDQMATLSARIPGWLVDCRNQCRAENVTWLIRQFAAYVDSINAVQKESDMIDTAIVGLALKDQQNPGRLCG